MNIINIKNSSIIKIIFQPLNKIIIIILNSNEIIIIVLSVKL